MRNEKEQEWYSYESDVSEDNESVEQKSEMSIVQWVSLLVVVILATGAGLGVGVPLALGSSFSSHTLSERLKHVERLLKEVPLIDGHNDLPWNLRQFVHNQLKKVDLLSDLSGVEPWAHSAWSQTDLNRMRKGHVGAQFWSAYVPCDLPNLNIVQQTLEQIDLIKRMVLSYPKTLALVYSSKGIKEAHAKGKIGSLIGLEGGHSIANSLGVLRMMYDVGVRYMTLTHVCSTLWAESASRNISDDIEGPTGLTDFGRTVIVEMNRAGMMIDLSHVSGDTMRDVLSISRAPVIFTHSGSRTLCNHSRNIPDDVLHSLAHNGGVAMVPFYTQFISCSEKAYISDVIDHINYIRDVAGIDHVGIGSDFDGIDRTPVGLEDVSKYPYLLAELMKDPTWEERHIKQLAGLNMLRVFAKVEKVRDDIQKSRQLPSEEILPESLLIGMEPYTFNCSGDG